MCMRMSIKIGLISAVTEILSISSVSMKQRFVNDRENTSIKPIDLRNVELKTDI